MDQTPKTLPTSTISTGSIGSARNVYYSLREAFKLAINSLPSVLENVPEFYQNEKTYFLLRRQIYPLLFSMKEQDEGLALEWIRRHWPDSSKGRVLQDIASEGAVDYLEEMIEDLKADWRLHKESWQAESSIFLREEADSAHSRVIDYLSMEFNFLNPRIAPVSEKEMQKMAANTLSLRRYQKQARSFIEKNGIRFSSLLRNRPSAALKMLIGIDSPAIQAGILSRRENPEGCMALREIMMDMQTGKGEMVLSKFLQTFFTIESTRSSIETSRKLPLYYIADALIDAGLYARAQEILRSDSPQK